jgi:hypothetical protein
MNASLKKDEGGRMKDEQENCVVYFSFIPPSGFLIGERPRCDNTG